VIEMHVDGFRFDLAATLAREFYDVDRLSAFFELVQQDPIVSQVKLIAEPWDLGPSGYQVGKFPPQWTELNGKYRDTVRDFWRGEAATLGEFAYRLTGSVDLYEHTARRPVASVNFVTAHDGLTLRDLVSYNEKHNEANGEDNNDGESNNKSWNCDAEGPTDDPEINALRGRQQRNFLTTTLLSQGVPMISHGDELGRTQGGNNNGYCQDNEITWIDWAHADTALPNRATRWPRPDPLGLLWQVAAISTWSSIPVLGCIDAPTLVVCGEYDRVVPPANSRLPAARIRDARLVTRPDTICKSPVRRRLCPAWWRSFSIRNL
jgi:isoamylase